MFLSSVAMGNNLNEQIIDYNIQGKSVGSLFFRFDVELINFVLLRFQFIKDQQYLARFQMLNSTYITRYIDTVLFKDR